jgi:hypothetical protein
LRHHRFVYVHRIVAQDVPLGDDVTRFLEQLDDGAAAQVGLERARVANRQHGAAHAADARLAVLGDAHR